MIQIEQTQMVPGGGGNCLAACIASVFELPLSDVWPEVPNGGGFQYVCEWTACRYPALAANTIDFFDAEAWKPIRRPLADVEWPMTPAGYWIARVESPRAAAAGVLDSYGFPTQHCVVMLGSVLVWDPHPSRDMGVGPCRGMYWWSLRDPSKLG